MERPLPDLAREITAGAVRLAAATAAWLRLIAEFDRREGWSAHGIVSCAHWLAWQCGMAPVTAREHVRVARPGGAVLRGGPAALGRVGEPEDVGRVVAALLSQDLGWVNAQSIEVGGGYNI